MNIFRKKRSNKVDPDELHRKAAETISHTKAQQPHVNLISSWLIWRTEENGFGGDFDYTISPQKLIPKET